jgi:hypothetical protein
VQGIYYDSCVWMSVVEGHEHEEEKGSYNIFRYLKYFRAGSQEGTRHSPDTQGPVTWLPNALGSCLVPSKWCGKYLLVLSVQCIYYFIVSAF